MSNIFSAQSVFRAAPNLLASLFNGPNKVVRLNGSGLVPAALIPPIDEALAHTNVTIIQTNSASQPFKNGVLGYNNSSASITVSSIDALSFSLNQIGLYEVTVSGWVNINSFTTVPFVYPVIATGGTSTLPSGGATPISLGEQYGSIKPFYFRKLVNVTAAPAVIAPQVTQTENQYITFIDISHHVRRIS